MDEIGTTRPDLFRPSSRAHKPDYKQKLERGPVSRRDEVLAADVPEAVEAVHALAAVPGTDSVAFQCVAVAVLQTLARVRRCEVEAAEAALSLAQRQNLDEMTEAVDATADALRYMLTAQGARMLDRKPRVRGGTPEHSWWFALSEALQVIEEGMAWIQSVAAGQPAGSPTHALAQALARLLQPHHDALLHEAEQWLE